LVAANEASIGHCGSRYNDFFVTGCNVDTLVSARVRWLGMNDKRAHGPQPEEIS
jgi:hypothetical protein